MLIIQNNYCVYLFFNVYSEFNYFMIKFSIKSKHYFAETTDSSIYYYKNYLFCLNKEHDIDSNINVY